MEDSLDKFGKFLVENFRDKGIYYAESLLAGIWKAPSLQDIQTGLSHLSITQKEAVKKAIISTLDSAMHDFLFALQVQAEYKNEIQITVDKNNIVDLSDGIHGEAYSDDGWYAKYSKYEVIE
ncbi:hypothetical protein [Mucilaginibacter phyllosphaerae]|uniref:Uncharacterized protein n=1 Tax=Mucilaginibacter phyllosphaerae TaxID=1812349 RepID=A0A4Y8AIG8_9SPHI|nr:hypothetical protein [Mucilaginibacter phyllosphaerae]MBB3968421.1 hypothetical protein [Mucilaginibacter phyllosphaerae]TEW67931.1 hypothetical protein E2R65_08060 [Mucilaginibacter phyllosphaerae]GGH16104.1 hypothetical protein GCM10007352_25290 [Mucilaginibacter phyllosphaerae]